MPATYRAVEVTAPGEFRFTERPVVDPGPGQVRVRVEAAGICHSDSLVVEGRRAGISYPRVPGHEIAGRIDALGDGVTGWSVGDRGGVGWFGGNCGHCKPCQRGRMVNCRNLIISGLTVDGGYAEMAIVEARALALIPEDLRSVDAAPLLCAGVTTFNALRNSNLRPGDLVAVHGIGGLGHLAVQFARKMGFHTVAIARGADKAALALRLGAHSYIDSTTTDPVEVLKQMGGADGILTTATSGRAMGPLVAALAARGKLIAVGSSAEPLEVSLPTLLAGSRTISGELVGTAIDEEDTMAFSVLQGIAPMIEVVSLEQAPDAFHKMMQNEARFRMVIELSEFS